MRTLRARYRTPLMKEEFRITNPSDGASNAGLGDYLRSANFEITELGREVPLDARLAHYAQTTLAMVTAPRVTVRWKRDEASRARTLLLFARKGKLSVSTQGPVVRRGGNAIMLLPSDRPAEVSVMEPRSELIYISAGAGIVPPLALDLSNDVQGSPLPWHRIAPLYAFVHAVCTSPPTTGDEPDVLAACSEAIVESCARTIVGDISAQGGVVLRVRAFIAEYHNNPNLTLASISDRFGIATRTLQAAFSTHGSTVRRELREARTRTAQGLRRTHPQLSQSQVARLSGFASLSAMYRSLHSESDDAVTATDNLVTTPPGVSSTR
ncbi:hypothetical protein ACTU6V_00830 [Microbacterium sp. A204]|uniref:hypothetical protein n=1 Tax=Microbacterium sp. A204 TaxID=3457321 RepID=UPI003FD5E71D